MASPSNPAEHSDDGGRFFRGLLIGSAISLPMWGVILFLVVRAL